MADSQLKLPGDFKPGKAGMQRHDLMIGWRSALVADRVIPGTGISESQTPQGRVFNATAQAVPPAGAFFAQRKVSGDTYLQGGTVTGGGGTETIAEIKVVDADTGPVAAAGHHLYISANGGGLVVDGVLLPGFDLTTATTATAAAVPGNSLPTASDAAGQCRISLGEFTESGFTPNLPGNLAISFCPGNFTITRA